ncbi:divergent PAP2 family protein [Candidatus Saccharibacteria bacterium]|nr:divergent PAP2 family protein [Candidatus Saccharibacteria bacterium]
MEGLGGLVAFVAGWFCAQTGKLIGDMIKTGRPLSWSEIVDCFVRSGGMPSGHTASFLALTVFLGMQNGFLSNICVLAMCTTVIVIYDAVNVRYAVGEQGKMLNVIAMDHNYKKRKVKVVEGHTIPQVAVGAVIGVLIGIVMGVVF